MMDKIEKFLRENDILDAQNVDALLALSDLVRKLILASDFEQISKIIKYTLDNNVLEAFSWIISVLEEMYNSKEINNFIHNIGRTIANYDKLMELLDVNYNVYANTTKIILDKYGEPESFFNILIYKTKYNNVYLLGAENFDVKDNDFIQYELLFTNDIDTYIKKIEHDNRAWIY